MQDAAFAPRMRDSFDESERVTIQPGWLWDAVMQPFNRIDVVYSHGVSSTSDFALTEQMLPSTQVSGYDSSDRVRVSATSDRIDGMEPGNREADMEVSGAGNIGGAGEVRPVQFTGVPSATPGVDPLHAPQDEVFISPAARLLQNQDVGAASRAERLAEIRAQISQGVYDTPEKLALAVDRLVQDLNRR